MTQADPVRPDPLASPLDRVRALFTDAKNSPYPNLPRETPTPRYLVERFPELGPYETIGDVIDALGGGRLRASSRPPPPASVPSPPPSTTRGRLGRSKKSSKGIFLQSTFSGAEAPSPLSLCQIRRLLRKNQAELAADIGWTQSDVSKLERREDPRISSLQRYARALGAELEVAFVTKDGRRITVRLGAGGPTQKAGVFRSRPSEA